MVNDDVLFGFRLRLFSLAAELGNVRAACRIFGVHPSTCYRGLAIETRRPRPYRRDMVRDVSRQASQAARDALPDGWRLGPATYQPDAIRGSGEPERVAVLDLAIAL